MKAQMHPGPKAGQAQRVSVSVIILTWNSEHEIAACLTSLAQGLGECSFEVIVIDNGSKDKTCAVIEATRLEVRLLRNSVNRGVAPARNQGISLARGEYILILDDDTIVRPGAFDCLIRYMESQPEVGLCGPKLTDANGNLRLSCGQFPTLVNKLARCMPSIVARKVNRTAEMADWDHRSIREVDYVIGACQLIRRRVLREVGLYDERFFYGAEDFDMCLRMRQTGWLVIYNPDAAIMHKERRASRSLKSGLLWKHVCALGYFFYKHGYLLSRRRLYARLAQSSQSVKAGRSANSPAASADDG